MPGLNLTHPASSASAQGGACLGRLVHGAASSQFQGTAPGTALGIISCDSPTLKSHLGLPLNYVHALAQAPD